MIYIPIGLKMSQTYIILISVIFVEHTKDAIAYTVVFILHFGLHINVEFEYK